MFGRALGYGFLGGVAVVELYLLALVVLTGSWGEWRALSLAAGIAAPVAGLIGMADGAFALLVVWLVGEPARRSMPLASLLGGIGAAALPGFIWVSSVRLQWLAPLGLIAAAFLAGAVLTWPVLTGRPCIHELRHRT